MIRVKSPWSGRTFVFVTVAWPSRTPGQVNYASTGPDESERFARTRLKRGLTTWCER